MTTTKWLNVRLDDLQVRLAEQGHRISLPVISRLLHAHDYRLHLNVKQREGENHPQRDEQFAYLVLQRTHHVAAGQPTISVDTKKKELVGNFKNPGRTWGIYPEAVNVHDFRPPPAGERSPMASMMRNTTVAPSMSVNPLIPWPLPWTTSCAGVKPNCPPLSRRPRPVHRS